MAENSPPEVSSYEPSPDAPLLGLQRNRELWTNYLKNHRRGSYSCCVVLVIAAALAIAFLVVIFPILETLSHHSSTQHSIKVPFLTKDRFLVDCFENVSDIHFSHTSHSASLSMYVEKPSELARCKTSVSKSLSDITGEENSCRSIDVQYLVEGAEIQYTIEETTGSPYNQPFSIVVCQNLSLYETFNKSDCSIHIQDCPQEYNMTANSHINFSLKGEKEPRYAFVGAKFRQSVKMDVEISGTKVEYKPTNKCQFCDDNECPVLFDGSQKTKMCVLVELDQCKQSGSHDASGRSNGMELEQCNVTHASDEDKIVTLSYTLDVNVAEERRSVLWDFAWVFLSLGVLSFVTAAAIVLFFGRKFVCP